MEETVCFAGCIRRVCSYGWRRPFVLLAALEGCVVMDGGGRLFAGCSRRVCSYGCCCS